MRTGTRDVSGESSPRTTSFQRGRLVFVVIETFQSRADVVSGISPERISRRNSRISQLDGKLKKDLDASVLAKTTLRKEVIPPPVVCLIDETAFGRSTARPRCEHPPPTIQHKQKHPGKCTR